MRFTALVVAFVFTATSVTWTTPANAATADVIASSVLSIDKLSIPVEMGTIAKVSLSQTTDYRPQTIDSTNQKNSKNKSLQSPVSGLQSRTGESRFVVLIQDAHAVIDAQENISKILGHLGKAYGVRLAALEGGKGRLEPTLLRTFPDSIVKRKILAGYENRAELSGPEMAAVLQEEATDFRGMEDWSLYERNYFAYLRAQEKKAALLERWNEFKRKLDSDRAKAYDPKLNEFQEARENFLTERASLLDLLVYLSNFKGLFTARQTEAGKAEGSQAEIPPSDLAFARKHRGQNDATQATGYQELPGLIESIGYEKSGKQEALVPLVRQIADEFKMKYLRGLGVKVEMNFYNRYQAFMTGQITAGQMLQYLVEVGRENGKNVKLTPALKKLLGHAELLSEIKGSRLYDELQRFLPEVEASLIKTPAQREIADQYEKLFLLKEMITLELTHEALAEYQKDPDAYLGLISDPAFKQNLAPALEFYQAALERDQAFMTKIDAMMKDAKQKTIAVVAGGFHTKGLERILKEKGVSYAVVTPKIASLTGSQNYAKVMKGDVSFKDYLKTTYFDALMRHAAKALVEALPIPDRVRTLKVWRDNVIRELAKEGRITDAGKFLPYIDEVLQSMPEAATAMGPKRSKDEILDIVRKELEKFKADSLERLWKTFEFQLNVFTDGLKQLITKKDLNAQSVSALLDRAGQTKPSFINFAQILDRSNGFSGPIVSMKTPALLPEPKEVVPVEVMEKPAVAVVSEERASSKAEEQAASAVEALDIKNPYGTVKGGREGNLEVVVFGLPDGTKHPFYVSKTLPKGSQGLSLVRVPESRMPDLMVYGIPTEGNLAIRGCIINSSLPRGLMRQLLDAFFALYPNANRTDPNMVIPAVIDKLVTEYGFKPPFDKDGKPMAPNAWVSKRPDSAGRRDLIFADAATMDFAVQNMLGTETASYNDFTVKDPGIVLSEVTYTPLYLKAALKRGDKIVSSAVIPEGRAETRSGIAPRSELRLVMGNDTIMKKNFEINGKINQNNGDPSRKNSYDVVLSQVPAVQGGLRVTKAGAVFDFENVVNYVTGRRNNGAQGLLVAYLDKGTEVYVHIPFAKFPGFDSTKTWPKEWMLTKKFLVEAHGKLAKDLGVQSRSEGRIISPVTSDETISHMEIVNGKVNGRSLTLDEVRHMVSRGLRHELNSRLMSLLGEVDASWWHPTSAPKQNSVTELQKLEIMRTDVVAMWNFLEAFMGDKKGPFFIAPYGGTQIIATSKMKSYEKGYEEDLSRRVPAELVQEAVGEAFDAYLLESKLSDLEIKIEKLHSAIAKGNASSTDVTWPILESAVEDLMKAVKLVCAHVATGEQISLDSTVVPREAVESALRNRDRIHPPELMQRSDVRGQGLGEAPLVRAEVRSITMPDWGQFWNWVSDRTLARSEKGRPASKEVKTRQAATDYRNDREGFNGPDMDHYVAAMTRLSEKNFTPSEKQDLLAHFGITASRAEKPEDRDKEDYDRILEALLDRGQTAADLDTILNGTYEDPRFQDKAIDGQNPNAPTQGLIEAVANSLDALGAGLGQFGKGVKQILAWLKGTGRDRVDVYTAQESGNVYKLTILQDTKGQSYIQVRKIRADMATRETGVDLKKGTLVRVTTGEKISEEAQAKLMNEIHRVFCYVPGMTIQTQYGNNKPDEVNGFKSKREIVPAGPSGYSREAARGKDVLIRSNGHSISVLDNGEGMNGRNIAFMFVPRQSQKSSKTVPIKLVGDEKRPRGEISFLRNGRAVATVRVPEDLEPTATADTGVMIELSTSVPIPDSWDKPRLPTNLQGKSKFKSAIEYLISSITDPKHPLTPEEKIRYVNTIIVGLEALVQGNPGYATTVNDLRLYAKNAMSALREELISKGYVFLPHDRAFAKVQVPRDKEGRERPVLYLDPALFDWGGVVSLQQIGGEPLPSRVVLDGKKVRLSFGGKALVIVPFTDESLKAIRDYRMTRKAILAAEDLPFFETEEMIALPDVPATRRLLELALMSWRAPEEEYEFTSLLEAVNILTSKQVVTDYEITKPKPHLEIQHVSQKEQLEPMAVAEQQLLDSVQAAKFLVTMPSDFSKPAAPVSQAPAKKSEGVPVQAGATQAQPSAMGVIPQDALQEFISLSSGNAPLELMDLSTGKRMPFSTLGLNKFSTPVSSSMRITGSRFLRKDKVNGKEFHAMTFQADVFGRYFVKVFALTREGDQIKAETVLEDFEGDVEFSPDNRFISNKVKGAGKAGDIYKVFDSRTGKTVWESGDPVTFRFLKSRLNRYVVAVPQTGWKNKVGAAITNIETQENETQENETRLELWRDEGEGVEIREIGNVIHLKPRNPKWYNRLIPSKARRGVLIMPDNSEIHDVPLVEENLPTSLIAAKDANGKVISVFYRGDREESYRRVGPEEAQRDIRGGRMTVLNMAAGKGRAFHKVLVSKNLSQEHHLVGGTFESHAGAFAHYEGDVDWNFETQRIQLSKNLADQLGVSPDTELPAKYIAESDYFLVHVPNAENKFDQVVLDPQTNSIFRYNMHHTSMLFLDRAAKKLHIDADGSFASVDAIKIKGEDSVETRSGYFKEFSSAGGKVYVVPDMGKAYLLTGQEVREIDIRVPEGMRLIDFDGRYLIFADTDFQATRYVPLDFSQGKPVEAKKEAAVEENLAPAVSSVPALPEEEVVPSREAKLAARREREARLAAALLKESEKFKSVVQGDTEWKAVSETGLKSQISKDGSVLVKWKGAVFCISENAGEFTLTRFKEDQLSQGMPVAAGGMHKIATDGKYFTVLYLQGFQYESSPEVLPAWGVSIKITPKSDQTWDFEAHGGEVAVKEAAAAAAQPALRELSEKDRILKEENRRPQFRATAPSEIPGGFVWGREWSEALMTPELMGRLEALPQGVFEYSSGVRGYYDGHSFFIISRKRGGGDSYAVHQTLMDKQTDIYGAFVGFSDNGLQLLFKFPKGSESQVPLGAPLSYADLQKLIAEAGPATPEAKPARDERDQVWAGTFIKGRESAPALRDRLSGDFRKAWTQGYWDTVPQRYRADVAAVLQPLITGIYEAEENAVRQKFLVTRAGESADYESEEMPFVRFAARLELLKNGLAQFLASDEAQIAMQKYETGRSYLANLFRGLFELASDSRDISLPEVTPDLFNGLGMGWSVKEEWQRDQNNFSKLQALIRSGGEQGERLAPDQAMRIVTYLSRLSARSREANTILMEQLARLESHPQYKTRMLSSLADLSEEQFQAYWDNPHDPKFALGDAVSYLEFLSARLDPVRVAERFVPAGEDFIPEGQKIGISQITQADAVREQKGRKVITPEETRDVIASGKLPKRDEKLETSNRLAVDRHESGAAVREIAQNSKDAMKTMGLSRGELEVDFYIQKGEDGESEFVEQTLDDSGGAEDPLALVIEKSTKADDLLRALTGMYGSGGKGPLYQDADRVEILTRRGGKAYYFEIKIERSDSGEVTDISLVKFRKITDLRPVNEVMKKDGVMTRRIKNVRNTIPELAQRISRRNWLIFTGLAVDEQFQIYFRNGEAARTPLALASETLSETEWRDPYATEPSDRVQGKFGILSVPATVRQVVDNAGLRVASLDESSRYVALIPPSLRYLIKQLNLVIRIPLPQVEGRGAFKREDIYLPWIQRYVAIEFYKALARKTLLIPASKDEPQFVFHGFPHDWLTDNRNGQIMRNLMFQYRVAALLRFLGILVFQKAYTIVHAANQINRGRYGRVSVNDLELFSGDAGTSDLDSVKRTEDMVKFVSLLRVPSPNEPNTQESLAGQMRAVSRAALLGSSVYTFLERIKSRLTGKSVSEVSNLPHIQEILSSNRSVTWAGLAVSILLGVLVIILWNVSGSAIGVAVGAAQSVLQGEFQREFWIGLTKLGVWALPLIFVFKRVLQTKPKTDDEKRLVDEVLQFAKPFGIKRVVFWPGWMGAAGLLIGNVFILNKDVVQELRHSGIDEKGYINKRSNLLAHETAHLLETVSAIQKGRLGRLLGKIAPWIFFAMVHDTGGFSHEPVGEFADAIKTAAAVPLLQFKGDVSAVQPEVLRSEIRKVSLKGVMLGVLAAVTLALGVGGTAAYVSAKMWRSVLYKVTQIIEVSQTYIGYVLHDSEKNALAPLKDIDQAYRRYARGKASLPEFIYIQEFVLSPDGLLDYVNAHEITAGESKVPTVEALLQRSDLKKLYEAYQNYHETPEAFEEMRQNPMTTPLILKVIDTMRARYPVFSFRFERVPFEVWKDRQSLGDIPWRGNPGYVLQGVQESGAGLRTEWYDQLTSWLRVRGANMWERELPFADLLAQIRAQAPDAFIAHLRGASHAIYDSLLANASKAYQSSELQIPMIQDEVARDIQDGKTVSQSKMAAFVLELQLDYVLAPLLNDLKENYSVFVNEIGPKLRSMILEEERSGLKDKNQRSLERIMIEGFRGEQAKSEELEAKKSVLVLQAEEVIAQSLSGAKLPAESVAAYNTAEKAYWKAYGDLQDCWINLAKSEGLISKGSAKKFIKRNRAIWDSPESKAGQLDSGVDAKVRNARMMLRSENRMNVTVSRGRADLTAAIRERTGSKAFQEFDLANPALIPAGAFADAVRAGSVLRLKTQGLSGKNKRFKELLPVLIRIGQEFDDAGLTLNGDGRYVVQELLKNALEHGNQLNLDMPVFLYVKLDGSKSKAIEFRTYDLAVKDQASSLDLGYAHDSWGKQGIGIDRIKARGWAYDRQPVPGGAEARVARSEGRSIAARYGQIRNSKKQTFDEIMISLHNQQKDSTVPQDLWAVDPRTGAESKRIIGQDPDYAKKLESMNLLQLDEELKLYTTGKGPRLESVSGFVIPASIKDPIERLKFFVDHLSEDGELPGVRGQRLQHYLDLGKAVKGILGMSIKIQDKKQIEKFEIFLREICIRWSEPLARSAARLETQRATRAELRAEPKISYALSAPDKQAIDKLFMDDEIQRMLRALPPQTTVYFVRDGNQTQMLRVKEDNWMVNLTLERFLAGKNRPEEVATGVDAWTPGVTLDPEGFIIVLRDDWRKESDAVNLWRLQHEISHILRVELVKQSDVPDEGVVKRMKEFMAIERLVRALQDHEVVSFQLGQPQPLIRSAEAYLKNSQDLADPGTSAPSTLIRAASYAMRYFFAQHAFEKAFPEREKTLRSELGKKYNLSDSEVAKTHAILDKTLIPLLENGDWIQEAPLMSAYRQFVDQMKQSFPEQQAPPAAEKRQENRRLSAETVRTKPSLGQGADSEVYQVEDAAYKIYRDISLKLLEFYQAVTSAVKTKLDQKEIGSVQIGGVDHKVVIEVNPILDVYEMEGKRLSRSPLIDGIWLRDLVAGNLDKVPQAGDLRLVCNAIAAPDRKVLGSIKTMLAGQSNEIMTSPIKINAEEYAVTGITLESSENVMLKLDPDGTIRLIVTDIASAIKYVGDSRPVEPASAKVRAELRVKLGGLLEVNPGNVAHGIQSAGSVEKYRAELRVRAVTQQAKMEKLIETRIVQFGKELDQYTTLQKVVSYIRSPALDQRLQELLGEFGDTTEFASRIRSRAVFNEESLSFDRLADNASQLNNAKIARDQAMLDVVAAGLVMNGKEPSFVLLMDRPGDGIAEEVLEMIKMLKPSRLMVYSGPGEKPFGRAWDKVASVMSLRNKNAVSRAVRSSSDLVVSFWTQDRGMDNLGIYSILAEVGRIADPRLRELALTAVRIAILRFATLEKETQNKILAKPALIRGYLEQFGIPAFIGFSSKGLVFNLERLVEEYTARQSVDQAA